MVINQLAFWSAVALVERIITIGILLRVSQWQIKELETKGSLMPVKRRLLGAVVVIIISNLPIIYLHYERIIGNKPSDAATSFATVTNAVGMLIFAILFYMTYKIRIKE